jgi:hypothetical protein
MAHFATLALPLAPVAFLALRLALARAVLALALALARALAPRTLARPVAFLAPPPAPAWRRRVARWQRQRQRRMA